MLKFAFSRNNAKKTATKKAEAEAKSNQTAAPTRAQFCTEPTPGGSSSREQVKFLTEALYTPQTPSARDVQDTVQEWLDTGDTSGSIPHESVGDVLTVGDRSGSIPNEADGDVSRVSSRHSSFSRNDSSKKDIKRRVSISGAARAVRRRARSFTEASPGAAAARRLAKAKGAKRRPTSLYIDGNSSSIPAASIVETYLAQEAIKTSCHHFTQEPVETPGQHLTQIEMEMPVPQLYERDAETSDQQLTQEEIYIPVPQLCERDVEIVGQFLSHQRKRKAPEPPQPNREIETPGKQLSQREIETSPGPQHRAPIFFQDSPSTIAFRRQRTLSLQEFSQQKTER
ncbi:unnamed protein product [Meganyctiphanes norvegica]|uniref:Uncharacterized protein n=1 Tax=Meganyctiphanes norvegica TaxID=48144 RepID=A0AAV2Q7J8_MEGNR